MIPIYVLYKKLKISILKLEYLLANTHYSLLNSLYYFTCKHIKTGSD